MRVAVLFFVAAIGCSSCTSPDTQVTVRDAGIAPLDAAAPKPRVVLYTKETEWFHPSTPVATKVILERGKARGWEVETSNDSAATFDPTKLAKIDAIVFLNTSGMTMNQKERDAFASFIATGHGWAGVHAASHTDYDWTFMHEVVGATFCCHPPIMPAYLDVQDTSDPIVSHLPKRWPHTDEWYTYDRRPEANARVKVLLTLDEKSAHPNYPGPNEPALLALGYHATTWTQEYGATRTFYTGLGHTIESWSDDLFVSMVVKGIEWTATASTSPR